MARLQALACVLVSLATTAEPASAQGHVIVVDDASPEYGGGWTFDLAADGTLDSLAELPVLIEVSDRDHFGAALASLGDLNGDGHLDLVVASTGEDRAGIDVGALWILFRAADGSVANKHALRPGRNFRGEPLAGTTAFGTAVATLGDLDGNGSLELAVGAKHPQGAVWILSLEPDGAVSREVVLAEGSGGFGGDLDPGDDFGGALAAIGDLDGDGVDDLAVGARGDDDGASSAGALWLLYLNADASVKAAQKISNTSGAFGGLIDAGDQFGSSVASLGDVDGNGVDDLAVGARLDDDGGGNKGALWILLLAADGTVDSEQKISATAGGLGALAENSFGASVAGLGDLDADGVPDILAGATTGGAGTGAVLVLFLNDDGSVKSSHALRTEFTGVASGDQLGTSLAYLGDEDEDGRPDVAVGAGERDGAPTPPDFTELEDALAAAAEGDTILLRGGSYSTNGRFEVTARSLTIQAASPQNVLVVGGLTIADLNTSQSVRLSGLRFYGGFEDEDPPLALVDNAGVVWVDDCDVPGSIHPLSPVAPGVEVSNCGRVVLNRCNVGSSNGGLFDYNDTPFPALTIGDSSSVHAHDCTFTGAAGNCGTEVTGHLNPQPGGPAIVSSSLSDFLFLSGCDVQGGSGQSCGCDDGGIGMQITGQARVLDTTIAGGTGCPLGSASTGSVTALSGERLGMIVDNPRRESEDTLFFFEGPPEAAVFVQFSLTPGAGYRPALHGTDVLGSQRVQAFLGRTDAQGRLLTYGQQNDPPPGFDVLRVFAQSLYVQPSSTIWTTKTSPAPRPIRLGSAAMITRLDSAF